VPLTVGKSASAAGPIEAASNDATSTLFGAFGTTSGYVTIHTHSRGTNRNKSSIRGGTPSQNSFAARPKAAAT